ncbi:10281_t:CDS:2 [Funneliformis geosporum]|uniref:10281_t:CDS:1 n=1 Tax=Funneliformis geosporum TaxID=1117311 RepID=A0A9W4SA78_9GLOM|nr:10281_t:CDS:2 [Funneliformis geosporum]
MPPYQTDATLTQKVQLTYQTLLHSTHMRSRSLSLVNAYYLGQLIDAVTISSTQWTLQMAF